MIFGSQLLTIDLVDASTNISSGSVSDDKVIGSILSNTSVPRNVRRELFFSYLSFLSHFLLQCLIVNFILLCQDLNLGLDGFPINVINMKTATFRNGSTIPNGSYRLLFRALRVTGNPKEDNLKDYDFAFTESFGVRVQV